MAESRSQRSNQFPVRVGVVGLGVGAFHAHAYQESPYSTVVALADHDLQKADQIAERLDCGAVSVSSFEEILTRDDVDLVSIATYDDMHSSQVLAAIEAGKHVFVEKPLCRTFDELKEIHEAWLGAKGKIHLSCNLVLRSAPIYRWLRDEISNGSLGKIYSFEGDYLYGRFNKIINGWRGQIEGYSAMQGGGIHLIDLLVWMLRERPISVTSMGNSICSEDTSFHHDDHITATMRCASGVVAKIGVHLGCIHPHQHVVKTFGTKGTFLYDDQGARLQTNPDPPRPPVQLNYSALPESKGALIPPFLDSIKKGVMQEEETQRVFDGMSVAIACDKALKSGSMEHVEYVT